MTTSPSMRSLAAGLGFGLAVALSACASSTPYQPAASGQAVSGGYSDVRITDDRYRVTFAGNSFTSRDRVEGYLLYRAAELTVQSGYDWFSIVDRDTEHHVQTRVTPDPFYHPWYGAYYGYWTPYWRYYGRHGWVVWRPYDGPFWANRVDVSTVERFEATAEIVLGHGAKPADDPKAFDAREVIARLGPTIERPKP